MILGIEAYMYSSSIGNIAVPRIPDAMRLQLTNDDFSLAVSDFKTYSVATRFKTDGYAVCEIVVEN